MERWKKYSSNPLERIKIVYTDESSPVRCLNCGRILRSEFVIYTNEDGYQTCPCGYINYFELIGDFTWEQRVGRAKTKKVKTSSEF